MGAGALSTGAMSATGAVSDSATGRTLNVVEIELLPSYMPSGGFLCGRFPDFLSGWHKSFGQSGPDTLDRMTLAELDLDPGAEGHHAIAGIDGGDFVQADHDRHWRVGGRFVDSYKIGHAWYYIKRPMKQGITPDPGPQGRRVRSVPGQRVQRSVTRPLTPQALVVGKSNDWSRA